MLTIDDILRATGGALINGRTAKAITGVSIDSRTLKKGNLFIAVKGNKFDGHDFIGTAIKKGASAIVTSGRYRSPKKRVACIKVKDTVQALGKIAQCHRNRFNIPIIAITGSTGKTTTKDMVADVMSARHKVLKSIKTNNNHIGVPLTLLKLRRSHDMAVLELGTNHFGEIRYLAGIANPTVAILTNIGESHLEFLKSLSGVFQEKSTLIKYMHPRGHVIFNNDDPYLRRIASKKGKHPLITFGIDTVSRFRASDIRYKNNTSIEFRINKNKTLTLKTPAVHNIYSALAAVACGRLFNISYYDTRSQLGKFRFLAGRQHIYAIGRYTVIDDTYNSNPISFRSAVKTLENFNTTDRKVLICADMLELGKQSKRLHCQSGQVVAASDIDCLITYGKYAQLISDCARKENKYLCIFHCTTVKAVENKLKKYLCPGDVILVKGSRLMRMERIISFIKTIKTKG